MRSAREVGRGRNAGFPGKVIPLAVVPPSQMPVVQVPVAVAGSPRNKPVRLQRIIRRFSFVSNQILWFLKIIELRAHCDILMITPS